MFCTFFFPQQNPGRFMSINCRKSRNRQICSPEVHRRGVDNYNSYCKDSHCSLLCFWLWEWLLENLHCLQQQLLYFIQCSGIVLTLMILQKGNMLSDLLILVATESLLSSGRAPCLASLIYISWTTIWSVTVAKMSSKIQYHENVCI